MAKLYRKLEARAGNITFTRNIQGYVCWYSFLRAILREKMKKQKLFSKSKISTKNDFPAQASLKTAGFFVGFSLRWRFSLITWFSLFFCKLRVCEQKRENFPTQKESFLRRGKWRHRSKLSVAGLTSGHFWSEKPVTLFKKRYISKF